MQYKLERISKVHEKFEVSINFQSIPKRHEPEDILGNTEGGKILLSHR